MEKFIEKKSQFQSKDMYQKSMIVIDTVGRNLGYIYNCNANVTKLLGFNKT